MMNYECDCSQSETEKYFELMKIIFTSHFYYYSFQKKLLILLGTGHYY